MDYVELLKENRGGFSFDNVSRNAMFSKDDKLTPPTTLKTGTTICGVVCKDAVVLAADTRATEGPIVADKVCDKLHNMAVNICCAGAGTSGGLSFCIFLYYFIRFGSYHSYDCCSIRTAPSSD